MRARPAARPRCTMARGSSSSTSRATPGTADGDAGQQGLVGLRRDDDVADARGSRHGRRVAGCAMVGAMIETIAEHLTLERSDRVAVVTVNRPEARNAMTFPMYEGLHDLCDRLDADAAVRVVILRGSGDRAFVSGTDIRQFQAFKTKEDALGYEARINRVLNRI